MALSLTVGAIIFGGAVRRIGYYISSMYIGVILIFIGAGLMTSFERETSFGKRIGYRILVGFGIVVSMQQSSLCGANTLDQTDIATGVSLMVFGQSLGGVIFMSIAQAIFNDYLTLHSRNVGLDVHSVTNIGATELIKMMPIENLDMIIQVYNEALKNVFILVTVVAAFAIVLTLLMELKKLKQKPESRESPGKKEEA
jgi:MFS family permease